MLHPSNLHDYQWDGADYLVSNPRSALWAGLGLGKTVMTLTALEELRAFGDLERVLIIAPKRVAATVWHTEAANWSHTKDLRVFRAVGAPNARRSAILQALAFDHGIVTINPENLQWLVELLEGMHKSWPFDTVVFDESSMFKSHDSNRFKTMEAVCCDYTNTVKGILNQVESPVKRVFELTATPAASGIENLWSQMKLLDSGQRLGVKVTHFRKAFMRNVAPPGVRYGKWEPTRGAAENVYEAISDIVKVMLPEDYLDMPELLQRDIVVDIPVPIRRDMEELESNFLLEIEEDGFDLEIIAANAGALANKLMQFSNGSVYSGDPQDPDYEKRWVAIHDAKLDALAELDDTCDHPLLIAYWFQSDLERIARRFGKLTKAERAGEVPLNATKILSRPGSRWQWLDKEGRQIDDWNAGKIDRLLLHPACLAADTEVLTEHRGWQLIISVSPNERVFDGVEFVSHSGCTYSGHKEVIETFGVRSTLDHKFLINNDWVEAQYVGTDRSVREALLYKYEGDEKYLIQMLDMRHDTGSVTTERNEVSKIAESPLSTLHRSNLSSHDEDSTVANLARHASALFRFDRQGLRRSWDNGMRRLGRLREILGRYAGGLYRPYDIRKIECEQGVLQGQLCLDNNFRSASEQAHYSQSNIRGGVDALSGVVPTIRDKQREITTTFKQRNDGRRSRGVSEVINVPREQKEAVYDLVDCGPRNRFIVRGASGDCFIAHNSAGHGLNLQYGGNTFVLFSMFWSLELYQQLLGRLHRQGQSQTVTVNRIVIRDSVEQRVAQSLANRAETQDELLEYLKEHGQ